MTKGYLGHARKGRSALGTTGGDRLPSASWTVPPAGISRRAIGSIPIMSPDIEAIGLAIGIELPIGIGLMPAMPPIASEADGAGLPMTIVSWTATAFATGLDAPRARPRPIPCSGS